MAIPRSHLHVRVLVCGCISIPERALNSYHVASVFAGPLGLVHLHTRLPTSGRRKVQVCGGHLSFRSQPRTRRWWLTRVQCELTENLLLARWMRPWTPMKEVPGSYPSRSILTSSTSLHPHCPVPRRGVALSVSRFHILLQYFFPWQMG